MMRKWTAIGFLLALTACGSDYDHRGEEFSQYYRQPSKAKGTRNLERQKIVYHVLDTKGRTISKRKIIGILEKNEVQLEGLRNPRQHYAILDSRFEPVGFITEEGRLFRYDRTGRRVPMGEYPVLVKGIKVFFDIPLSDPDRNHKVELLEIDPYRDF